MILRSLVAIDGAESVPLASPNTSKLASPSAGSLEYPTIAFLIFQVPWTKQVCDRLTEIQCAMDLPTTGDEDPLRDSDPNAPTESLNINRRSPVAAIANNARSDGDNKFQNAISAWRGDV